MRRSFFHFESVRGFKSYKNHPVRVRVTDMVRVRVRVRVSVRVWVVLRRDLLSGELKCAFGKISNYVSRYVVAGNSNLINDINE